MPIKRLERGIRPAFPRLGKLRKGDKKTDPKQPGKDLEYFRFTSPRPEVVAAFVAAYGPGPTLINVFLPFAEPSENFSYWQEVWTAGGMVHRCDGETCVMWQQKDGTYSTEPKACPGGCTEVGRLEVIIPELLRAGYVGYVTMETHSINDILSILGSLAETANNRAGHPDGLKGIMFILRRVPESISTPPWEEGDPRRRVTKWLVKLEPAADWVKLQLEIAHAGAMGLTGGEVVELPQLNGGAVESEIIKEEPVVTPETDPDDPFGNNAFDPDNPTFQSYDELYYRAIEHLGYNHMEHAKNALKKITRGDTNGLTHQGAWQLLKDHQAAKEADAEPETGEGK